MNSESKSHSQQRPSYQQQSRNRYGNNNNYSSRRRIAIVEACGDDQLDNSEWGDEVDGGMPEIHLMSIMPNGPLDGSELFEDSIIFQNRDAVISTLTGYGYPKTRARVFLEFIHTESDTKGRALIDSGANITFKHSLYHHQT